MYFNFSKIGAYHKVKFWVSDPHGLAVPGSEMRDVVHVRPGRKNKYGTEIPGRFDTALVRVQADSRSSCLDAPSGTAMQSEFVWPKT